MQISKSEWQRTTTRRCSRHSHWGNTSLTAGSRLLWPTAEWG